MGQIENDEHSHLKAFKKWLENSEAFKNLDAAGKDDLTLYIAGLLREIADLKGDLLRQRLAK